MVGLTLKSALAVLALAGFVAAVDPTPEERKKWDDKCKAKSGNMYSMVFDSNGKPTGTCRAPPYKGCYWGPYTDPKTGAEGCCEKGNGVFTTDPVAVLEGGCCIPPETYSFDSYARKGGCCPKDLQISWDLTLSPVSPNFICCPAELVASTDRATGQNHCCPPGLTYSSHLASGKGECCEPGKTFSFDEGSGKGDCCAAGQSYKIDPLTGKGGCCGAGADYKCDCKCVTPGDDKPAPIDDKDKPVPTEGETGDKDKPVPTEEETGDKDKEEEKDNGADIGDPKHCPEVGGRVVTVGGVTYEIQCDHGISDRFESYREKTTKDVGECMEACSADPRCQGANLFDDGADEGCVMMKDWEYPATGGVDPTANMMSFVPIKKR